jgi:hypothetical protein
MFGCQSKIRLQKMSLYECDDDDDDDDDERDRKPVIKFKDKVSFTSHTTKTLYKIDTCLISQYSKSTLGE